MCQMHRTQDIPDFVHGEYCQPTVNGDCPQTSDDKKNQVRFAIIMGALCSQHPALLTECTDDHQLTGFKILLYGLLMIFAL